MTSALQTTIETAFDARHTLGVTMVGPVRSVVAAATAGHDDVNPPVEEPHAGGAWQEDQLYERPGQRRGCETCALPISSRPPAGACRLSRHRHRRLARQLAFSLGIFMTSDLQTTIEAAWDARNTLGVTMRGPMREAVAAALAGLDDGSLRVAERNAGGAWQVNQWLKKAVLLSFRLNDMAIVEGGPGGATWWDKVPSKFAGWGENRLRDPGFRAGPGATVRHGPHTGKGAGQNG